MRRILLTTALLLLSVVCLCATETIGTMQFDYVLNKVSAGEVSRVFFASPSAPDVPLTSLAIDMFPDHTDDTVIQLLITIHFCCGHVLPECLFDSDV